MQKFEYRGARFAVDLPVRFTGGNRALAGRCIEMSKEGLKLDLEEPLESDSCGKVFLSHQGRTLEFYVRVVHVGAKYCGMEFIYSSDAEQLAVAHLVESLAIPQTARGLVLLKTP
jgi:PilZ domain